MMVTFTFRALRQWPKEPTRSRQRARFDTKHSDTMALLEREVSHLGARTAILEADCDASEIRLDGQFRANARMRGPGIVLRIESKHGPLTYPCDTFSEWQDNLRAIALALEALRKVDRYGVSSSGEQYRGWLGLPDKSKDGAFPDQDAAIAWLEREFQEEGPIVEVRREWQTNKDGLRRLAMRAFHPDRNNGSDSRWRLWLDAAKVLGIEV